jgi:DNA-binding GntR family transcriptional regulator
VARQKPLRQVVVDGLLARIESGELAPGEWFTSTDVRRWFDVGREPANTALRTLVDRGDLDVHPGKGYRVPESAT